jgi:hypothetical protein
LGEQILELDRQETVDGGDSPSTPGESTASDQISQALTPVAYVPVEHVDQLEDLKLIQSGLVQWTQKKVGQSNDPLMQQAALDALAHQIYPLSPNPRVENYLANEINEIEAKIQTLTPELERARNELASAQKRLSD